jgi:metal-responsive CopG/Arc/MetJ family transcriptional regulator
MLVRITLTIDDDLLAAAKAIAKQERRSAGDVISALARSQLDRSQAVQERNGLPLLARNTAGTTTTLLHW